MTRRLANNRGVVLLLAVYFSALLLLLLGGVSLQRTNMEVRASRLSRDVQQGVFLAEASLDRVLTAFRADPLISDDAASASGTFSLANGTVQAAVVTPADAIQTDGSEIRRVTLTGTTSNGIAQRIYAVLQLTGDGTMPFREGLTAWGGNFYAGTSGANPGILTLNGPVGSTLGTTASVVLVNTKVNGPVFVSPPATRHPEQQGDWYFIGHAVEFWGYRYNSPYVKGLHVDGMAGFGPIGSAVQTINAQLAAKPMVLNQTASTLPQRSDLADYDNIASCHGDLHLASGETYWVRDGSSLDSDPTPDKILFCVESAYLDTNSQLLFDAPATMYLVDNVIGEGTTWTGGAYFQLPGAVVQAQVNGAGLRNGVELVQRWLDPNGLPASGGGGLALIGISGEFYGSIWAPRGAVFLADDSYAAFAFLNDHRGPLTVPPVRVVASHVWLDSGADRGASSFTFRAEPGDGSPAPRDLAVSLVSWSLEPTPVGDTTVGHANPDDRAQVLGVGKTALRVTHDGLSYQSQYYQGP